MEKSFQVSGIGKNPASRSSQASMEYLFIVALTFLILIPTVYLFFSYSRESTEEITDAQITKLGRAIVDASETIFYSGQGSRTVLELTMPKGINEIYIIDGRELVFKVTTSFGDSDIVFFSAANMTTKGSDCIANKCTIPISEGQGLQKLKIESINKNSVIIEPI